jgi:succinyl-CoA synthetase alpha subunit
MEAADAGISTQLKEFPYMIKANSYVKERNARLIGPNCPGIIR